MLQKQHTAFLLELTSHEPQIAAVGDVAQELVDAHHFATDNIIERSVSSFTVVYHHYCVSMKPGTLKMLAADPRHTVLFRVMLFLE